MTKLLVTDVGGRYVGWLSTEVGEVLPAPEPTPLPEPYPPLLGTAFLGGSPVTLVDTATLLGGRRDSPPRLLLRLAPPLGHLGFPVAKVEEVLTYEPLALRDEEASGVWAGLYPWGEGWVSVVNAASTARALTAAVSTAIGRQTSGSDHAP